MINYDSILRPGERIVARGKLHVGAFVVPLAALLIGAAVVFLDLGKALGQFRVVAALLLVAGAWANLNAVSMRLTTQFVLTDERLLSESGLLRHRKMALPLREIDRVEVIHSLLGRGLGHGTLEVSGGHRVRERFSQITGVKELSRQTRELMAAPPPRRCHKPTGWPDPVACL